LTADDTDFTDGTSLPISGIREIRVIRGSSFLTDRATLIEALPCCVFGVFNSLVKVLNIGKESG
jgi:hypothetical protein